MKLLITGGAGFIGHNLAKLALTRGHEVRVLDDLSTGFRANLDGLDVDLRVASLLDSGAVQDAVAGMDSIIHLGALGSVPRSIEDPIACHAANATGTDAARSQVVDTVAISSAVVTPLSAASTPHSQAPPAMPPNAAIW